MTTDPPLDDELNVDYFPEVKVRFTFAVPPFRASWMWKGRERSIARWGPFAARDRAADLIDLAIEWDLAYRRTQRQIAADRRERRRRIVEVYGEEKARQLFDRLDAAGGAG